MNDWRPLPPPVEATPEAPASIREVDISKTATQQAEIITAELPQNPDDGKFKGLPVRVAGDKVWLLKDGKRHWVTTAEVYAKLGFKFGDEKEIDYPTLMALAEGAPIR